MKLTIAIPYLSISRESVFRDGLGKFLGLLIDGILLHDDEIEIEIWSFSQGVEGMKKLFEKNFKENKCRISIINDFDFYQTTHSYKRKVKLGKTIEEIKREYEGRCDHKRSVLEKILKRVVMIRQRRYLVKAVKSRSKADFVYYNSPCFLPLLSIIKPTLVQIHDLFTMQYERLFVRNSKRYFFTNKAVSFWLGIQGVLGAHFVSSSYNTLNNQVLKYIPLIKKERTHIIRFPAMVKNYEGMVNFSKEDFCKKYGIVGPYIAYPTQNRPNKNIITLLKSLDILCNEGINVKLVITGKFNDVKDCANYIESNPKLLDNLVETGNLSEEELYFLYKCSDMVVSTSFVEGGCISGQVLEALKIGDIPVIHALSDGIDEWLDVHGFNRKTADMNWFDRFDYMNLALLIKDVLINRNSHVVKQKHIFEELDDPTWEDVGCKYLELFSKIIHER